MTFIDSHAHLFYPDFQDDIDAVIKRAEEAGVRYFIVPGTNLETSRSAISLAEKFDQVYAAVGFHPLDMKTYSEDAFAEIEKLSVHPKAVAVGEAGLDYYYEAATKEIQQEVFAKHLRLAIRRDLPVIIHTRDSIDDAMRIVDEEYRNYDSASRGGWKGVFHCFSGNADEARKILRWEFLLSFTGNVTFKKSSALDVVQAVGYDHIMLETDAPFMTPVPFRGKRNEPAHMPLIAKTVADGCNAEIADVARTTTYNAKKLFSIGQPDPPQFVYPLGKSLYINMTIRCNADCVFCDRKGEAVVKGHNLKITREPSVQEVIDLIGSPEKYGEIVFCGYGEPTIRFDDLKIVAAWVKKNGGKVRLNTDGHGSVINGRNIAPEMAGLFDSVSISLNSVDPVQYGRLMRVDGARFHAAMIEFAREAKRFVPEVIMSVVGIPEVDQQKAKEFIEKVIGVKYRVRPYF